MKHSIRDDMTKEPVTIGPNVTIREAQEVMQIWGMRHLPVTNSENKVVGLLADRDIDRAFAAGIKGTEAVTEAMQNTPYMALLNTALSEVAKTMAENKYDCAVVVDSNKEARGIFTSVDALHILARILHEPGDVDFKLLRIDEYLAHHRRAV